MHVYWFKPLSVWWFIIAVRGNQYSSKLHDFPMRVSLKRGAPLACLHRWPLPGAPLSWLVNAAIHSLISSYEKICSPQLSEGPTSVISSFPVRKLEGETQVHGLWRMCMMPFLHRLKETLGRVPPAQESVIGFSTGPPRRTQSDVLHVCVM